MQDDHQLTGFIQRATGEFTVRLMPNTPHCGPKQTTFVETSDPYRYEIELTYNAQALDSEGFLIDNLWFRSYFDALRDVHLSISCELLAQQIARDMCTQLGDRACYCDAVCVRLYGVPNVSVECTYRPAQEKDV
jgi:hypothetical protein